MFALEIALLAAICGLMAYTKFLGLFWKDRPEDFRRRDFRVGLVVLALVVILGAIMWFGANG